MIVTDPKELMIMSAADLWENYMNAMDSVIETVQSGERLEAMFYMTVVKVSIDLYFDRVEEIVESIDAD